MGSAIVHRALYIFYLIIDQSVKYGVLMFKLKSVAIISLTLATVALSACGDSATKTQDHTSTSTQTAAVSKVSTLSTGTFSGRSDHITTGQVFLEKTASGYQLRFADDFSLDGAPDPVVALGNDDTYLASNKLGALKNKTGAQTYSLPVGFNPGEFSQVYVWCEKFSVPLGIAKLKS